VWAYRHLPVDLYGDPRQTQGNPWVKTGGSPMTDPQIHGSMVHGVWGWFTERFFLLCYGRRLCIENWLVSAALLLTGRLPIGPGIP
jgi:hypothetical protein